MNGCYCEIIYILKLINSIIYFAIKYLVLKGSNFGSHVFGFGTDFATLSADLQ